MKYFLALASLVFIFSCSSDSNPETNPEQETTSSPPEIISITIDTDGKMAGDEISIQVTASDPDNDISSYEWTVSEGSFEIVSDTEITWASPQNPGSYQISLKVTDSEGNTDALSENASLTLGTANFQNFIDAEYYRLYSDCYVTPIDDFIYFYSAEVVGHNVWEYSLRKYDYDGNLIWRRVYLNSGSFSNGRPIKVTSDGNMVLITNVGIIKINTAGDVLWELDRVGFVRFDELDNGNYLFAGKVPPQYNPEFLIVSPNGTLLNSGPIETEEFIRQFGDVVPGPQPNTSYLLARADSDDPDVRTLVIHMDANGQILDSFQLPYLSLYSGRLFPNEDGTYTSFLNDTENGNTRIFKVDFNTNGEVLSEVMYSWGSYTRVIDVFPAQDGGYLLAGEAGPSHSNNRSLMFRVDATGNVEWNNFYGELSSEMDFASGIIELPNGKVVVSGSHFIPGGPGGGQVKCYLHKYNPDGSL